MLRLVNDIGLNIDSSLHIGEHNYWLIMLRSSIVFGLVKTTVQAIDLWVEARST